MRRALHPLRSPGRAPLVVALTLALLALGFTLLAWQLQPARVAVAAPGAGPGRQTAAGDQQLQGPREDGAGEALDGTAASAREELASALESAAARIQWKGTVRDASSALPVESARVVLASGDLEESAASAADGSFALAWPADLAASLAIEHPRYVDVRAPSIDLGRERAFELQRSAVLRGHVEPPPVGEGALVVTWLEAANSQRLWNAIEAPVAPDGSFELSDLDPGDYVICAVVPQRCVAPQAGLHLERGETLELVLRSVPAARVEGLVLRMPQARGAPGVRIAALPQEGGLPQEWNRRVQVETTSDERGRYALAGLGPGRWRLDVETPWGVATARDLEVPGSGERLEVDLEVPGPARLAGRVADAAGRGVEGARVLAVTGRRIDSLEQIASGAAADDPTTTSGPSGAFALDEAPSRTDLVLLALAPPDGGDGPPRLGTAQVPRLEADEVRSGIEIVLGAALSVSGRVLGSQGEVVSGATVEARGRPGGLRVTLSRAVSDPDGRFQVQGLPAGPALLRAEHPDWRGEWVEVDPAARPGEVELRLQPACAVAGLALDAQGFGVADLPIVFEESDASGQVSERRARRQGRQTVSDEYGRFQLDGLPAGSWVVGGRSYDWVQVDAQPAVVVTPGDSFVTLTFAPRERPLRAEIRGEIALSGGGTPAGVRIEGLHGGVLSIDGGAFRATGLVPTNHQLTLRADGHAAVRTGAIDLLPGQVHDLGRVVLEPAALVIVRLRDGAGRALDGARVRLVPLPRAEGGAGEGAGAVELRGRGRGRYSTSDATLHSWRLVVDRQGFRRHARQLEIASGESLEVEVELQAQPSDG